MTDSLNSIASPSRNGASSAPFPTRPSVRRWFLLILILWLALFLRVWQLDVLPPGLHYDEAFNGTVAREVLRGINRPIFFVGNFGEEPMHMYAEAGLFAIVGESPWTIRLTSALFGVIFVAGMYACARAFFPRSDAVALSATFLAATLYWAINFSRIGIETNSLPPMLILSAAAFAHAYRKMSWRWVIGAGVLIGASAYTYLASRVWLVAVLLWFIYLVLFHRAAVRANFSKWVVVGLFACLTVAPLALFFVANPLALAGRAGTVFVPETFVANFVRTAGMFFVSGDVDPRDNLPGRPALDLILSVLFLIGLAISLLRFRKPFYGLTIIWFVVMCMPSALTEFAPNFRRAIGAMPATILFCALGFDWLWGIFANLLSPFSASRFYPRMSEHPTIRPSAPPLSSLLSPFSILRLLLLAALALSAFWSARAYFVDWASEAGLFYSFDAGLLQVGQALAVRPADEELYLSPKYDDHYTIIWALDGRPVSSFDGRKGLVVPDSSRAATYGIIVYEDGITSDALSKQGIQTTPLLSFKDAANAPYANILKVQATAQPSKNFATVGNFGTLAGASILPSLPKPGDKIEITLQWLALKAASENYTVSTQLIGPLNPATGSPLWAQDDSQPVGGTYPTKIWQKGQTIFDPYTIQVPPTVVPGHYEIQISVYLLETGARVPLFNQAGARLPDDAVPIKTFDIN